MFFGTCADGISPPHNPRLAPVRFRGEDYLVFRDHIHQHSGPFPPWEPGGRKPMNDRFVKTGVFLAPFHALTENPLLCLDRDMELLIHLDRLNYHEAWIGEHHSGGFEIIACPELFIAAAAERTRRIRLGTGVVSLPYHNPFTVAGRLIQLDYMTRGRAMFGVGPGSLVYDAVKMGIKAQDQRRKLDESLEVIMALMAG